MTDDELVICEWFALCTYTADGKVHHPVLGWLPCCTRCADKLDLQLVPFTGETAPALA